MFTLIAFSLTQHLNTDPDADSIPDPDPGIRYLPNIVKDFTGEKNSYLIFFQKMQYIFPLASRKDALPTGEACSP